MPAPKMRYESWFAAAILAVLTITVFSRLQDFGPTSAVRRFHTALDPINALEIRRVTVEPPNNQNLIDLERGVKYYLANSKRYEVARMDLAGEEVRAAVVYYSGNGTPNWVVFVLERDGRAWRINANKTIYLQKSLSAPAT